MTIDEFYNFMNGENNSDGKITPFVYIHEIGNDEEWYTLFHNGEFAKKEIVGVKEIYDIKREDLKGDYELFNINQILRSYYISILAIPMCVEIGDKNYAQHFMDDFFDYTRFHELGDYEVVEPSKNFENENVQHIKIIKDKNKNEEIEINIRTISNFAKYNNSRKFMDTGLKPVPFLKRPNNSSYLRIDFNRDMSDGNYMSGNLNCEIGMDFIENIIKKELKYSIHTVNVRLTKPVYC